MRGRWSSSQASWHTAAVSQDLFDRVQDVLDARSRRGQRDRVLTHYLKGTLYCQRCHEADRTSRLIYTQAKGRNGQHYGYYLCRSRQEGTCDLPHLPVLEVEEAICRHYRTMHLADSFTEAVEEQLAVTLADEQQLTQELHATLTKQLAKLEAREARLIDLAADGLLARDKIIERSNAIQIERQRIRDGLANTNAELKTGADRLRAALTLAKDPAELYQQRSDQVRRQLNHAFYQSLYLNDLGGAVRVTQDIVNPPFDEIQAAHTTYQRLNTIEATQRSRPGLTAEPASEDAPPWLADVFLVPVSSKRVMVEVLRAYSNLEGAVELKTLIDSLMRNDQGRRQVSPRTAQSGPN